MSQEMFEFNPTNLTSMRKLMQKYGDTDTMKFGVNKNGEDVSISICTDRIIVNTYQKNNKVRKNIYYITGESEEIYEE